MQSNPYITDEAKPNAEPLLDGPTNYVPYNNPQPTAQLEVEIKPAQPRVLDHLSDGLEGQARTSFIAKVYILLTSTSTLIQSN
jgi:hypothetical protein